MGKPEKFLPNVRYEIERQREGRGSYISFYNTSASAAVAAKETEEGGGQEQRNTTNLIAFAPIQ